MTDHDDREFVALLKQGMPPTSAAPTGADASPAPSDELRRDLWPTMLARVHAAPAAASRAGFGSIPWFDWVLAGAVAAWLVLFPNAIPILLYHL